MDKKIFKYKYRIANDSEATYFRRMDRVITRSLERAESRDPAVETDLSALLERDSREGAVGQQILRMLDGKDVKEIAKDGTKAIRDYMLDEAEKQYRDYYESDSEEQEFFEYLDSMSNRDKIRLIEIFEDHTIDPQIAKRFRSIPKREFNPELSVFSNLYLDLVDFKDRVKPLASDMSLLDQTSKY